MLANLFRRSGDFPISGINNPNTPIYQALAAYDLGGYGPATSGANVNHQTAMRVVTVHRCVTLIAQTIATLPLGVYRDEASGRKELTNPAESFLWRRPNPEMSRATMWAAAIGSCVLTGNGYIYKVRDGLNRVTEIWPMNPRMVEPVRMPDGEKRFRVGGTGEPVGRDTILHVPGYGDGFKGLSPIGQAREALGLAMSTEEFGARFFGQGSTLSGLLTTDQKLTDESSAKMEASWKAAHSGVRNAHKIALLEGGLKFQQIGVNPDDAQFLETRRFQVEEIARLFGIPPHLLGAVDRTTSWGQGIEEQNIAFITYTLGWWINLFEQAITDDLLAPANHYAKFAVNGLLRGNTAQRAAWYQTMRNLRVMNPNQIAALEDLPRHDGGDDYNAPFNSSTGGADATKTASGATPAPAGE